jgi:precorrin-6B methylase 1
MTAAIGSLRAVGVGISAPAQATLAARSAIEDAEKVFSLLADPLAEYWIRTLNPNTEWLGDLYAVGKNRRQTYSEMVERIVGAVRDGARVCVVTYGHPGVAAYPIHEAVRRARAEGFQTEMLAGISAQDCLFADLGIDPVASGWRSYEATDFLIHRRGIDPASNLILWQIGVIAESGYKREAGPWNRNGLAILAETLLQVYKPEHEVVVYEASRLPLCAPLIERIALRDLPSARVTAMSTLFVPPMCRPEIDEAMVRRLGVRRALATLA